MSCCTRRPRLLAALLTVAFSLGLGASACVLPNPDHCQNLALDADAWCSAQHGDARPYCSPCTAEHNGCVAEEPSEAECPQYSPRPESETGTGTGTGTEGTDSGPETETGTETETETG
ncbi:MAG: hypothetical protein R6X02_23955 [Enhygromyxa sp.]